MQNVLFINYKVTHEKTKKVFVNSYLVLYLHSRLRGVA
jgi:hypothetical protein